MISAVFFDFDGIIVDSEHLHWAAFNRVTTSHGIAMDWADYARTCIGIDDRAAFRLVFPTIGTQELIKLIEQKTAAFHELLATDGADALPGAIELIQQLSGTVPIAVCSGALRTDILPILGKLGIVDAFDTIVAADDTHVSKPDPAPYRLAMQRLGIQDGLAIEDTPSGITSAKGAGLNVFAVTNSYKKEALAQADFIVETLEGITLETLQAIAALHTT